MRRAAPLLLALLLVAIALPAGARCLRHDPAVVTLEGTLESRRLPGPPGYVSIGRGDYPETVLFLALDEPVCVSGDPTSRRNGKSHASIEEIQVQIPLARARHLVGKRVRATGSLSGAHTRAHRTPVVLSAKSLRGL